MGSGSVFLQRFCLCALLAVATGSLLVRSASHTVATQQSLSPTVTSCVSLDGAVSRERMGHRL
jgi:uncharacterized protein (AIM24 family)